MADAPEPVYVPQRRKQACSRCHTKRIKCLGGVPCRNCSITASPCIFPPPTKRSRTTSTSGPLLIPATTSVDNLIPDAPFMSYPSISLPGTYRRLEKNFASGRSSNDNRTWRPNYAGSPSCANFLTQFNGWLSILQDELTGLGDILNDGLWTDNGSAMIHTSNQGIEITIDSIVNASASGVRDTKPASIRLPPYNYSLQLIQVLEDTVAHEQHFFRRKQLRARLWHMHQNPQTAQSKERGWLCHWLAVIALGEVYSAGSGSVNEGGQPGLDYFHQSVALLPQIAESPDVLYIATLCLLCQYAFSLNRPNTAYMYAGLSLRAAIALKLHRETSDHSSCQPSLSTTELEHRKRLFWTVYYQELVTSCTTASPWGVLDDEISVAYGSSTDQSSDFLFEFGNADEQNQHLELMRLRSIAYSSLYGYAGTAINPYSHVSLMDQDLEQPLTSQHLDKMLEFQDSLIGWESELPVTLRVGGYWGQSLGNLNRVNANLYLIYHQSIMVLLRPALVMLFNASIESSRTKRIFTYYSTVQEEDSIKSKLSTAFTSVLNSALQSISICSWLSEHGAFMKYCYFKAMFLVSSIITLYLCRSISQSGERSTYFTSEHEAAVMTARQLLNGQAIAGNITAKDLEPKLELLDRNLQAICLRQQEARNSDPLNLLFE